MYPSTISPSPRQLGNGLVLRWSTQQDQEKLARAAAAGFASHAETPNLFMAQTVVRLMRGDCPAMSAEDFLLIEDQSATGTPIVACACLQEFEWLYEDVPLQVGRPEVVTTIHSHRNRGLTKALFAELHRASESRGHHLQAIVGIPNFYRRLGYEYAVDLGGKCVLPVSLLPQRETIYQLREATCADIPFLQRCYQNGRRDSLVWSTISEAQWRYYLEYGKGYTEDERVKSIQIIETAAGEPIGYLISAPRRWWKQLEIYSLELDASVNWFTVFSSGLLQALVKYGQSIPTEGGLTPLAEVALILGREHPAYAALSEYTCIRQQPDAWYIRIANIVSFLAQISPAIQRRIEASILRGYTGELKIDTYVGGILVRLERGRLLTESWKRDLYMNDADVHIPLNLLWQLILGYRDIRTLRAIAPDVLADAKEERLLDILFPAHSSCVLPLEFK